MTLGERSELLSQGPQKHACRDAHVSKRAVSINAIVNDAVLGNMNVDQDESKGVDHLIVIQPRQVEVAH